LQASSKASGHPEAFVVCADGDGVNMRKPAAASVTARKASPPAGSSDAAPVEVVCMALVLALFVLVFRIATVW